jgi:biopolymer transport protein ExbB
MDITKIIDAFGNVVYVALEFLAIWGVYNTIILYRSLAKKSLVHGAPLHQQVRALCHGGRTEAATRPTGTRP